LATLAIIVATVSITGSIDPNGDYLSPFIAVVWACYSVAVYAEPRRAGIGLALVLALFGFGAIVDNVREAGSRPVGDVLYVWTLNSGAWAVGRIVRSWRLQALALEERTVELEAEREWRARAAVAEERTRIARELHDVIAHSVSVMVVQAGAAERVLASQPDQARAALGSIQDTGRHAVLELRRLLGILRSEVDDTDLAPQPTLGELERLVGQVRDAGLPVEVRVDGEARPLPSGVELAAYRVVQEALTNTLKHGGPSAAAQVIVGYGPEELVIEVIDEGRPTVGLPPVRGGHGLLGMHERVSFHHGRFRAGPAEHGDGFTVAATFPLTAGPP